MLKRKVMDKLIEWKNTHENECLMVLGARQVGKTFVIREFAKLHYENIIEINFLSNEDYKEIFSGNLDSETILKNISIRIPDKVIIPCKTLLFLDEIQDCPNAITALKFLASDNRIDCIASGSMLGMAYKRMTSFPVGYVDRIYMNSLDFEEFCWANGLSVEAISYLKEDFENLKTINSSTHTRMLELFKEYIIVGGMPKVVNNYIKNHHFGLVLKEQRKILNDYRDDIVKYANNLESPKIRACFDSIPMQLAQENKKFKYSLVENKGTQNKYFSSLEWLNDAGIINFCYNLKNVEVPFEGNKKSKCFKVYMKDTGLLMAMLEDGAQLEIMNGNFDIYKGTIYENVIADIFNKSGKNLYYFEYNSTLEIDFFIRYKNIVTAVEVKSADNTKSKSLNSAMTNWGVKQGIKLSSKNIGLNSNNILSMPLYMSMFL